MKFYHLKSKQFVEVPDNMVSYRPLKNGAVLAQANYNGMKLSKITKKQ